MRRIADTQARALRAALLGPTHQLPDYLSKMFPSIRVEPTPSLPVAGISYWAEHRWHIHVRATDSANERAFTVLHQLKHIIDHPLKQRPTQFTGAEWESLADYFAQQVVAINTSVKERRNDYERIT